MKEFSQQYRFPGIALTGFGMPEDIDRGKNAGFSAIVVKPVAFDQLLAVVEKVMGGACPPNPQKGSDSQPSVVGGF